MVISIFTVPEENKKWYECKTGDICDCISYEYEKYFNGVGTFTIELPVTTNFREAIQVNSILVTDTGDALIVKDIKTTLDKITVTGYDLNGLLCDRITMAGTDESGEYNSDGYDEQEGTTEAIVKHYVSYNMVSSAVAERNLPRFAVADNKDRGVSGDHAYPRYQNLQELVTEICGGANLGWRVSADMSSTTSKSIFTFDIAEQVDRSVNQSDRNRVIFSAQMHNISAMTREVGVTSAKNMLYLDIDGTIVQYPQSGDNSGREVYSGYSRREEYCSLSGDTLEADEYAVEAEQNMADRMTETDSLTIEAVNPLDYGTLYDVGTIVTVYDKNRTLELDSVISAVTIKRTSNDYSVKLTLGEAKPKLLDQYAKKSEVTQKTVRNNEAVTSGSYTTAIAFKSGGFDLTFMHGGVEYINNFTVTEDSETGNITNIRNDTADREIEVTYGS